MAVAVALPTLKLSADEQAAVSAMRARLSKVSKHNHRRSSMYEGRFDELAHDLGISAPKGLPQLVNAVIGWPGIVVDVLEERLEFRGWIGDDSDLNAVVRDNQLNAEAGRGHLDALIYGCGFVTVGRGVPANGEPDVLVAVESAESCTVEWDYRARRAKAGLSKTVGEYGETVMETLYLPNETVRFEPSPHGMVVVDRDDHRLGRVPVARLLNRERPAERWGRSEITRAVAYLTVAAIRTAVGMEVNREFYTSPKWTVVNVEPAVFGMSDDADEKANKAAGWSATSGHMNVIPPQVDEFGNPVTPHLHEFRPSSPAPYIDQLRAYSQLLAAETGIPVPYLGFEPSNQSSADSIRQQEYRLVKRAERRQLSLGLAWREVAYLSMLLRDGSVDPAVFRQVSVDWRDASTPTRAAAADEAAKLIGAGVLPADSRVTLDRIGLSVQEQEELARDRQRSTVTDLVAGLRSASVAAQSDSQVAGLAGRTVAVSS